MEAELYTMRMISVLFVCQLLSEALPSQSARCAQLLQRMRVESSGLACEAACYAAYCPCQVPRAPCLASALAFGSVQHSKLKCRSSEIGAPFPSVVHNVWLLRKPVPAQLARRHVNALRSHVFSGAVQETTNFQRKVVYKVSYRPCVMHSNVYF